MHATVLREELGTVLKVLPLRLTEAVCQLPLSDALANKAIDESSIEVVAGSDGTHRLDLLSLYP